MTGGHVIRESGLDLEDQRAAAEVAEWTRRRRRKAPIAAFWSFLFPGAGQLYNHQPRLAVAFGIPIAVLLLAAAVVFLAFRESLLPRLLDSRVIIGLIATNIIILVWRLASMLQAHRRRARLRPNRVGTHVTVVLVILALLMHMVPAAYGFMVLDTLSAVSLGGGGAGEPSDLHDSIPGLRGPVGEPLPEPSGQPDADGGERVNVLLVGVDSGAGRDHALTDTMLIVSLDSDGTTAMLSIPRDLVDAPLPNGQPYPRKLNSLLQTASADPDGYPMGGVATLKATIGNLLGVPIHYFAAVDMTGFRQVIDAVGGVEVNVEVPVADPQHNLYLEPGPIYMDGTLALTYVRSRFGVGNNDFVRAGRQQEVIAAVRSKLTATNLFTALPGLLNAVQSTIATDVPSDRVPDLAELVQNADTGSMERAVIEPPEYVTPATGAGGAYILVPDLDAIRQLGQRLLGD